MSRIREIELQGVISTGNSTAFTLDPAGVFVGDAEDVTDFGTIEISVYSNVASATDGLCIQFSSDGTNWDHSDDYTVPAATGKNYSVQRVAQFFRIVYTNGGTIQNEFRLQTIFNQFYIKPSSHRLSDVITGDDDATLNTSVIKITGSDPETFHNVDAQHPVPIDTDSVYLKDIDLENSDNGGFSGVVTDYFDSLKTVNTDASATNPKIITIRFNRSIQTHSIGLGCDDIAKNFSNVILKILGSADEIRQTVDLSADSTKYNSLVPEFAPDTANGIIIEFHTADEVGLSNLIIYKATDVNARLQAQQTNGVIVDITATDSGNLKVSDAENGLAIAKGEVIGTDFVHKFGNAPDFDPSDLFVSIWDGADDLGLNLMQYVYSTAVDIDSISSSNAGDTQILEIDGLDTSYNRVIQTKALSGQARVALDTSLIRVFRVKNIGSVDLAGVAYCYVNTAIVLGVPTDTTKVRALILVGNNQTNMAIFTVPAGQTGYMRDWYAATSGARKTSVHTVKLKARPFGQVFQQKHVSSLIATGTSYVQHKYEEPEVFTEKTDIEMFANTDEVEASVSAGFDIVLVDN